MVFLMRSSAGAIQKSLLKKNVDWMQDEHQQQYLTKLRDLGIENFNIDLYEIYNCSTK